MSIKVDLILASSLNNSACFSDKNLIQRWWDELELGSSCSIWALTFTSSSILLNFSLISLVYSVTSQILAKIEVTLLKEFSRLTKIVDNSTYFIAMCLSTLLSNFLSAFSINFSWPEVPSLNLFTPLLTESKCVG